MFVESISRAYPVLTSLQWNNNSLGAAMRENQKDTGEESAAPREWWTSWSAWLISLLALSLMGLGLMIPTLQQRARLRSLEAQGAQLRLMYDNSWGQLDWSEWLRFHTGIELPLRPEVTGMDLQHYPVDDSLLHAIRSWPELRYLILVRAEISEAAVEDFVAHSPRLTELRIMNCPRIRPEFIRHLRSRFSGLTLEYRGTALLGIQGRNTGDGCQIIYVQRGSAADLAGLRRTDVIKEFNGVETPNFEVLVEQIAACEPGESVELTIQREEQELNVTCALQAWQPL